MAHFVQSDLDLHCPQKFLVFSSVGKGLMSKYFQPRIFTENQVSAAEHWRQHDMFLFDSHIIP